MLNLSPQYNNTSPQATLKGVVVLAPLRKMKDSAAEVKSSQGELSA